jgi:hypothetical protein
MAANDELLVHYRKTHTELLDDIKSFESFQRTKFGTENGKRVDVTAKWVQDLKRRAAGLALVIRTHERRNEDVKTLSRPS